MASDETRVRYNARSPYDLLDLPEGVTEFRFTVERRGEELPIRQAVAAAGTFPA